MYESDQKIMNKKISICIPTFNRRDLLHELLDSIIDACNDDNKNLIEICISDNASVDNTQNMVETWQKKQGLSVVYKRSNTNNGPDWNFINAASLGNGEYIWFMGSDDRIQKNAIKVILEKILSVLDIYLIGRLNMNFTMTQVHSTERYFDRDAAFDFSIRDQALAYLKQCRNIGGLFSYLSSIIVKRESWESHLGGVQEFYGSAYSHAYVLCRVLFEGGKIETASQPLVMNRLGNDSFLQNRGLANRVLIDLEGYLKITEKITIIANDERFKNALINIIKLTHPILGRGFYLRYYSNNFEWIRALKVLPLLGLSKRVLFFLDGFPSFINFWYRIYLVCRKGIKRFCIAIGLWTDINT